MLYNKLISNNYRANFARDRGLAVDEQRCSGRTTIIVLRRIADAIASPGQWVEVNDHVPGPQIRHVEVAKYAMHVADSMNLRYFERDANRIRSCHMTPNQMELK